MPDYRTEITAHVCFSVKAANEAEAMKVAKNIQEVVEQIEAVQVELWTVKVIKGKVDHA